MDNEQMKDFAKRVQKGGKGAGVGLGLIAAAAGIGYAAYNAMYTGDFHSNFDWC